MATASTTSLNESLESRDNVHPNAPIVQRPSELVRGYVREAQGQLRRVNRISPLIEYLCFMYFEIDRFDTASVGASMELQLNARKLTMCAEKPESAYLRHTVDSRCRRYTWKLRFNRLAFAHYWTFTIGIYKCGKSSTKSLRTQGIFTIDGAYPNDPNGKKCVAYGFAANKGVLLDADSGSGGDSEKSQRYGKRCGTGDVVEMTLDFDALELHYAINGTAYGCAFSVEDTQYRAAVNLCRRGDSIQIM